MPVIDCYVTGCTFATPNLDNAVAAVILSHHLSSAHPVPAQPKAPSIPPPEISAGIYEDQYDSFKRLWDSYKGNVTIADDKIGIHLLSCCTPELRANVECQDPDVSSKTEVEVLEAIKRHAVVSVAVSVLRTELLSLKQDHGETILAFASKALGKARNCKLKVKCPQGHEADYSNDMLKQVILAGMYDDEIKRKVLTLILIKSR